MWTPVVGTTGRGPGLRHLQIVGFDVHTKIQILDFGVRITNTQYYGQWLSVPKFNFPSGTLQVCLVRW